MKGKVQERGLGLNQGDCHLDQCTAPVYSSLPDGTAVSRTERDGGNGRQRIAEEQKKTSV